jgi:predicted amidophosphoribosyltransferase
MGARGQASGKRIVVVDDVITTADACARTLKRAGAARVDVLALARTVELSAFLL